MTETAPRLPEGWAITTVEITDTTTYRVVVAHPEGASAQAIAAAGYEDLRQEPHPETVFPHEVGEDEVSVDGQLQDTWGHAPWADRRPDHDTVVAILEATTPAGAGWAA